MLNSIQLLRAIAAWLVVFHHYMQLAHNFKLSDMVSVGLFKYGAIGVDLFFIISGFVIYLSATEKNQSPKVFAAHRLLRIAPAYWLFTLLTTAILLYTPGIVPLTQYDPLFLIKSLFFIPAQNPSGIGLFPIITVGWTLNFEITFYTIFFLSLYLPKRLLAPGIFIGVLVVHKTLPELGGSFTFFKNKIIYEFLFGICIAYAFQKGKIQKIPTVVAALMSIIAVSAIILYGPVNHNPLRSGLPCAAILLAALSQERLFSRIGFLGKLGDWSYSTYLCHVLVIALMLKLQDAYGLNPWFTAALIFTLIVAISRTSYNLIEKPISRLARTTPKPKPETSTAT
ncbi:acyltransferase family protein [Pseudomonas mediterranea]|uniref:acyltransferase family protein n=1 Tax=Pseudomonas mediterranea TaxID=183795 RepID=UPI0009EBC0E8|nr:acyltransferase [Pseudomonas mediterranea]MDU9027846.1 acyltransferase [Pseudomonas mediterranea]